jgi:hypothetical protein
VKEDLEELAQAVIEQAWRDIHGKSSKVRLDAIAFFMDNEENGLQMWADILEADPKKLRYKVRERLLQDGEKKWLGKVSGGATQKEIESWVNAGLNLADTLEGGKG